MNNYPPSHLFLLMECFRTRIKDLAEVLHVNDSLVSKWRNHKRLINPKSLYADLICQYYLKLDQKNNFHTIKTLLSDDYEQIENTEKDILPGLLKKWLTDVPDQLDDSKITLDSSSYTTQISIYHFDSGREKAVLRMLETLKNLPPNQEFLIFDCEENSWRQEESSFLEKRKKLLYEVINRHHLKIIHTFNAKYAALKNLFLRDISLNLNYKVDTHYIPLQLVPNFLSDMLIIKDKAALICQCNERFTVQRYAEYHSDIRTVRYYQQFYNDLQSKSIPIYAQYHLDHYGDILGFLEDKLCMEGRLYYISSLPFPFNTDIENLYSYKLNTQDTIRIWESALNQGSVRHIYCIKDIENFVKTIQKSPMPKAQDLLRAFLNQIDILIKLAEKSAEYEIALLNELPKTEGISPIFLIKDNRYALAYKYETLTGNFHALVSEDSTAVFVLSQYYDDFWSSIPLIQKNKEWVIHKLRAVFDLFRE
ncbi:hypothetical protein [Eubacterium sp. 1001713B170207_170306_E7]|uniref:hypothetical protein n=1 Tax=Eubacterium sp. 1001713B170207_170306_E7 TaxID=2787097 RepID=UPI001896AB98|nr:hypothetical protein [Eubacterium sp. 1001713B170207_170306_E7]